MVKFVYDVDQFNRFKLWLFRNNRRFYAVLLNQVDNCCYVSVNNMKVKLSFENNPVFSFKLATAQTPALLFLF